MPLFWCLDTFLVSLLPPFHRTSFMTNPPVPHTINRVLLRAPLATATLDVTAYSYFINFIPILLGSDPQTRSLISLSLTDVAVPDNRQSQSWFAGVRLTLESLSRRQREVMVSRNASCAAIMWSKSWACCTLFQSSSQEHSRTWKDKLRWWAGPSLLRLSHTAGAGTRLPRR